MRRGVVRVVIDYERDDYEALERVATERGTTVEAFVERAARAASMLARWFSPDSRAR